jgi:antitoxin (DNA-binding transcriptional repressor) of toxin-antitoxin stability system
MPRCDGSGIAKWPPVVITKHGKPVVKLVPANEGEDEIFGALAGIARTKGDIENTVPASDWGVE